MAVTATNETQNTATLTNQSVNTASLTNESISLRTFGEFTFDEVGTRTLDSLPETTVTFDTPFLLVNNEPLS